MSDYSDKSFKELYSEVVEYVKTLTTKWDPSVADEADPGVAILKAACLLFDKVNYRQNYRNSQNSVREVSDPVEGENLFYDLGYHVKKKRSATGNISVKYLSSGEESSLTLPLLTEFSDASNNITFTSVRKQVTVSKGSSGLVEVQEGIPVRYEYLGRRIFTDDDLTSNLRLPLSGYSDVASNGVLICSAIESEMLGGEEVHPLVSDWLNVGDNIFTSVETSNLYSIARDSSGMSYIQFYEDSLEGLKKGIKVWVLSSYGSAGNISSGRLNQVVSAPNTSIDNTKLVISHIEFTNGQDKESLTSAMKNYYDSWGVNDSLVSARDYSQIIESIIGPNLSRIASKALVSDVSGSHNVVEILAKTSKGGNAIFNRYAVSALVSGILVNALKYSDDYYESFEMLSQPETLNLIKKAIFKKNVLSNEVSLANSTSGLFSKYLFDFSDLSGTLIVNSTETEDSIKEKVRDVISTQFNSKNLTPGELIPETDISRAVKEGVSGVIDCSFYYKHHKIVKNVPSSSDSGDSLTEDEKVEVVSRVVSKGDLPLFERQELLLPIGAFMDSGSIKVVDTTGKEESPTSILEIPPEGKTISKLSGTFSISTSGSYKLKENEFIQFYREALNDYQTYGFGVKPLLLYPQTVIESQVTYNRVEGSSVLVRNSVIAKGSVLYSIPDKSYIVDGKDYEGIGSDLVDDPDGTSDSKPFCYVDGDKKAVKAKKDYKVKDYMVFDTGISSPSVLESGSTIFDGSFLEGKYHYALSLDNGVDIDFSNSEYREATLRLKTGDKDNDFVEIRYDTDPHIIRLENFSGKLNSGGSLQEHGEWGESFSSETLVTLVPDRTVLSLSGKFKYGLVTNHTFTEGEREYLLGEDDHFIYSDSDLIDFVDFGSGTLITVGPDLSLDKLTNRVSLSSDLASQLVDLPIPLEIRNTEIYTFTPGGESNSEIRITYIYSDLKNSSTGKWFKVTDEVEVKQGDISQVFSNNNNYWCRIGLVLKSGKDKTLQLTSGQSLTVEYQGSTEANPDKSEIKVLAGGQETYLSLSKEVYLNSATNQDLSSYNLRFKVYGVKHSGENKNFENILSFDVGSGFRYDQKLNSTIEGESYFSLRSENKSGYLLKVFNYTDRSLSIYSGKFGGTAAGGEGNFTQDTVNSAGIISKDVYSSSRSNNPCLDPGDWGYVYIPKRVDSYPLGVKFTVGGGATKGGMVVIDSQASLEGFNPDLFFIANSDYTPNPTEVFSKGNGNKILERVTQLAVGNSSDNNPKVKLDFEYIAETQLKNPTEAIKYYDTQHPLNRNILTVINLDSLVKNLKIVRRIR